jgi:diguanylate cyclase (GGDEF)-like protein/PAS domain S-box-containing protein
VLYVAASTILNEGYGNLETQSVQRNMERALEAQQRQLNELNRKNLDWSTWDDTYEFVHHPSREYIKANLSDGLTLQPTVDVILFYGATGKLVYGKSYVTPEPSAPCSALLQFIDQHPSLLQHATPEDTQTGIIMLPEGPIMVSSQPILNSQGEGPIRGSLIMGRYLNQDVVQEWAEATRLTLTFHNISNVSGISTLLPPIERLRSLSSSDPALVYPQNAQTVSGFAVVPDLTGKPSLVLQTEMPREIYQQGQYTLRSLLLTLVIIGIVSGGITQILAEQLMQMGRDRREAEARYRTVVAQASEGIVLIDTESHSFLEVNASFEQLLGYSAAELMALKLEDVRVTAHHSFIPDQQEQSGDPAAEEWRYRHRDGGLIDVEVTTTLIENAGKQVYCMVVRDITERKLAEAALRESEQRLAWQANHDDLTQLVNRRKFEQCLKQTLRDVQSRGTQNALCYLDLDQFKIINDTCGHAAGDKLLRQITTLLQAQIRPGDVLARLGGDEFGLLLHHYSPDQALEMANLLREQVQNFRFFWEGQTFTIGVSIGLVVITAEHTLSSLLSIADAACYVAKKQGRNRVHFNQENDRELMLHHSEMQWVAQINRALEENRFCLYYQTIAPIRPGVRGGEHYEVLLRLSDESGAIIPPDAFLPAAERYGLMHQIDRWVIHRLFTTQAAHYRECWRRSQVTGHTPLFAINLSGESINDDQFVEFLQDQFELHRVPPQVICFEITETVAITNLTKAIHFIHEMKQLGCQFALDDFGSGMSSFGYLKELPIDYLKIDGQFIRDILDNEIHQAMTHAFNQIGHLMQIQTIAEFVENDAILQQLRLMGVDYAQGYGIARPLPLVVPSACKKEIAVVQVA